LTGYGQCRALTDAGASGKLTAVNGSAHIEDGHFFGNPVFLSAILSLLTAQFLKSVINILRSRSKSLREVMLTFFWKTGGMPSSHSALVVSLSTAIAVTDGMNSCSLFASPLWSFAMPWESAGQPVNKPVP
jgi:acid phosphatase family membrane protein YuiD